VAVRVAGVGVVRTTCVWGRGEGGAPRTTETDSKRATPHAPRHRVHHSNLSSVTRTLVSPDPTPSTLRALLRVSVPLE
jgi:hypothetical protein